MSVTVHQGDCRAVLATLPAQSVQCIVTSPPYYGLRDYGCGGQIGLEPTPDEYVAQMVAVFREVRRVLRDDGTLWLNIGDSYNSATKGTGGATEKQATNAGAFFSARRFNGGDAKEKDLLGIPWALAFALRADGWYLRSDIIWHKPNPMPESVRDRPTKAHEYVFLLTKQPRYFYDADAIQEPHPRDWWNETPSKPGNPDRKDGGGRQGAKETDGANARSVWTIATQPFSGAHFATMPPDLAERCIKAGTSERGQCPHCGASWVRIIEKGKPDSEWQARCGANVGGGYNGQSTKGHDDAGVQNASDVKRRILAGLGTKRMAGWMPSCECSQHEPVPQTVLDPFGGAGTTGLVADRLRRDAVLIELNPEYAAMARARVRDDAPLIAEVA